MQILLTGGAGFIGSHTAIELLNKGMDIIIVDDFSNSDKSALDAIKKITGKDFKFYEIDYHDKAKLEMVFKENKIDSVINFAGSKAVGESVKDPLRYHYNNSCGAITLLQVMQEYNVKNFVFSSSATVYGIPETIPLTENSSTSAINPYGSTKLYIEHILKDLYNSDNSWNICILRYFNPIGAHPSRTNSEKIQKAFQII